MFRAANCATDVRFHRTEINTNVFYLLNVNVNETGNLLAFQLEMSVNFSELSMFKMTLS